MTPGNDGASKPEDDDPFGYLYADGQASGAVPPSGGGYGYPGPRSYHGVHTVGERQYGQQAPAQPQGYGQQAPQQQYDSPNPHYSAPETLPGGGGRAPRGQAPEGRGSRGRGPNTRGLLIGAVAVVAAVVVGIGIAVLSGGSDDENKAGGDEPKGGSSAAETVEPTEDPGQKPKDKPLDLPKADAKSLTLAGGTVTDSGFPGAKADGGVYVAGLNNPGAQVTWTVNGIPKEGEYTLFVGYGVPGHAAEPTLAINGKVHDRKLNMDNFAGAKEGDWAKGWTQTFAYVNLNKGTNTFVISCQPGDKCDANLDQVWLKEGHVKKG